MAEFERDDAKINNKLDLDAHIPARLLTLSARIALHAARRSAKPHGLSIREWRIIQILGAQGPSTINDVASRVAMDFGGTSRAIAALETRGLVLRNGDALDRRVSRVHLSGDGVSLHDIIVPFAIEREKRLLATLDDAERVALQSILDKLERQASDLLCEKDHSPGAGEE